MHKRASRIALMCGLALAVALPVAVALAGPAGTKNGSGKADSDSVETTVVVGKGRLGVSILEISPELRAHLGAPRDRGVLVNTVRGDSPAAKAGVAVGDVIVEVDGAPVEDASQVLRALSDRKKGETVSVALVRSGKSMTVSPRMEDEPGPIPAFGPGMPPGRWRDLDRDLHFDMPGSDPALRRDLERAQKRIQELERRLDKLEQSR
jgi:membrane-associated protease RseP (regulator of RpoE activity)